MKSRDQNGRKWLEAGDDVMCACNTDVGISSSGSLIRLLESSNQSAAAVALHSDTASSELSSVCVSSDQNLVHSSSSCAFSRNDAHGDVEEVMQDLSIDIASKTNHDIFCCSSTSNESLSDDWEAIADRGSIELLPPSCDPGVADVCAQDTAKVDTRKWRGRGTSLYKKDELYSDRLSEIYFDNGVEVEDLHQTKPKSNQLRHGDVERFCCKKPQTSARTARRMIAHGMGLRLPSSSLDAKESMAIEESRKNRILFRQKMRDDAWGC